MATQVEVELSRVSDANVDCGSCWYVTTLTLLDTLYTTRLNDSMSSVRDNYAQPKQFFVFVFVVKNGKCVAPL